MYRTYEQEIIFDEDTDMMSVEAFCEGVDCGAFTEYQGEAFWVKGDFRSNDSPFSIPQSDATHVLWFNK